MPGIATQVMEGNHIKTKSNGRLCPAKCGYEQKKSHKSDQALYSATNGTETMV